MSLTKPTFTDYTEDEVLDLNEMLAMFSHGKLYMADGEMTKAEADAMFDDVDVMATDLESNAVEISDLGETPGSENSSAEELPTSQYLIEGSRTNTVELNLIGLSQDRKDWLEQELNKKQRTLILVSDNGRDALVFNGLRWVYAREGNFGALFAATIKTQYKGASHLRYRIYMDIPDATP